MKPISLSTPKSPTQLPQAPQALRPKESEFQRRSPWQKIGHWVYETLVLTQEPKIWLKRDREGLMYWEAFDPVNQTRDYFATEADVRVWLEQRYYH
ncbi:MAG: hypothetical protein ACLFV6_12225 [Spirulinaceae cyanobacterium]